MSTPSSSGADIDTKMVGNVIESQFFKVPGGFPTAAALVHPSWH